MMDSGGGAPTVGIDPEAARCALLGRPIGPHLPIAGGLARAGERARMVGAGVIQVFSDKPTAWTPRAEPPEGLADFRRLLRSRRIDLLVHASYLVNLATPDPVTFERSILRVDHELDAGRELGARMVNVHVGSHKGSGTAVGVARVGQALAIILDRRQADVEEPLWCSRTPPGRGPVSG